MKYFLTIFFTILSAIFMLSTDVFSRYSDKVLFSSLLIVVISYYHIFSDDAQPFSLHKIQYLFTVFFFGIAPYVQFANKVSINGSRILTENDYFTINILYLIIILAYQFFYYFFKKIPTKNHLEKRLKKFDIVKGFTRRQEIILILLSLISFTAVFYFNSFSLLSMLFRGGEFKEQLIEEMAQALLISRVVQPISIICLIYYIYVGVRNRLVLIILSILALITCSPMGMTRFQTAAFYIPLIIVIMRMLHKKYVFSIGFIAGLLIVFPFLNIFRYYSSDSSFKLKIDMSMFEEGHFDNYNNFALLYFSEIITWGNQLLGVLFFWIPRGFWPNKPVGSGFFLAESVGLDFPNISANYYSEGYINFGIFGILLFIIIIACYISYTDKVYWRILSSRKNYLNIVYYVLLGMLVITLRGDLMTGFANSISFLLAMFIVRKLAR